MLAGVGLATAAAGQALAPAPPNDPDVLRQFLVGLQTFYHTAHPEKTYLHLDKSTYAAGETIWLKAYLAEAM